MRDAHQEGVYITSPDSVAPDGDRIVGVDAKDQITIFSGIGKPAIPVRGTVPGELPIRWTSDGTALYVHNRSEIPLRIFKVDVATGRRQIVAELKPANSEGLMEILRVVMTADASSYAYSYTRELSDLFLVFGLR